MRFASPLFLLLAGCPYVGEKEWRENIQDWDQDGFLSVRFGGPDCRDDDPGIGDCDSDGDGQRTTRAGGEDCDDEDATRFPGAPERCDGVDQDCDGQVDEIEDVAEPPLWSADDDGDGWGDPEETTEACERPAGYVDAERDRDCDDADPEVNPEALEFCDDLDWNCDGDPTSNATDRVEWYVDADGDGLPATGAAIVERSCEPPPGTAAMPAAAADRDCDDLNDQAYPGAAEVWYDGVDQDCAGGDDFDADGDGARLVVDCDDGEPTVRPDAIEVCDDVDNDCDGLTDDADPTIDDDGNRTLRYVDADGDTYGDASTGRAFCLQATPAGWVARGDDCDDRFSSVRPDGQEICDDLDNDCNGAVDDNAVDRIVLYQDADGDGFGTDLAPVLACDTDIGVARTNDDCNDSDAGIWPGAEEICNDTVRQDCSTLSPYDCDGDGFDSALGGGTDCDDTRDDVNEDAHEVCDGVDNDCDARVDDDDPNVDLSTIADWYRDLDEDGFGDPAILVLAQACAPVPGAAANGLDCDDGTAAANPDEREGCDGIDNDCDGDIDDADADRPVSPPTYFRDNDLDGFGDPALPFSQTCLPPAGGTWVLNGEDCQPGLAAINPYAVEICDGLDNNCDDVLDDADPNAQLSQWYADLDGDGWGQAGDAVAACGQPAGRVAQPGDCDDFDRERSPGAPEICDTGIDNDCDGLSDDDDPDLAGTVSWFPDVDGDGYGDENATATLRCGVIPGFVTNAGDCDDTSATRSPAAIELCNAIDDDCDEVTDDADPSLTNAPLWYADADVDGWGSDTDTLRSCAPPAGHRPSSGDCDDADPSVFPNADERCDSVDNDCDAQVDDADPDVIGDLWYADADGDTYGGPVVGGGCGTPPPGQTIAGGDCDDAQGAVHPGTTEVCDGLDDDCDGRVDDADPDVDRQGARVFADADGDGFGDGTVFLDRCVAPVGFVSVAGDCAPTDAARSPSAVEQCNGIDDDCDGSIDVNPVIGALTWDDGDGDGFGDPATGAVVCFTAGRVPTAGDCDDAAPPVHPGAAERCDTVDNDCDGLVDDADPEVEAFAWYGDGDGDGYGGALAATQCTPPGGAVSTTAGDCDDGAAGVHPGANESCGGADEDCDGLVDDADPSVVTGGAEVYRDLDGDGFGDENDRLARCVPGPGYASVAGDGCAPSDPARNPSAVESCNGLDDDCDGTPDDNPVIGVTTFADADGDGFGDPATAALSCATAGRVAVAGDCDDGNAVTHVGASEVCNTVDDDCDGQIDDADPSVAAPTWYADTDADTFGGPVVAIQCTPPGGAVVLVAGDCDDGKAAISPSVPETCSGIDDDCDGLVDDADPSVDRGAALVYQDLDGDGFGDVAAALPRCAPPAGYAAVAGDECAPGDPTRNPSAVEVCNGLDDDCDGTPDDNPVVGPLTFADVDGDGFGDPSTAAVTCAPGAGRTAVAGDCADGLSAVNPAATEVCDGQDNDCDGAVDALDPGALLTAWYTDADGDGFGTAPLAPACTQPLLSSASPGDCDDAVGTGATVHPGVTESCDGLDNDCDGLVDGFDPGVFVGASVKYADADGDGFHGTFSSPGCGTEPGFRATPGTDCDDTDSAVFLGAPEVCDGQDNNCDGSVDDADPVLVSVLSAWTDFDGDGYGDADLGPSARCGLAGTAPGGGDCDDASGARNPGATETCNGQDDDCDGLVDAADPGVAGTKVFRDADGDGFGNAGQAMDACGAAPPGFTADDTDCNDLLAASNPGTPEKCNGFDDDCDGLVDDADGDTVGEPQGRFTFRVDADHDGFGAAATLDRCAPTVGLVDNAAGGDCDDANPSRFPGQSEVCDGVDNDCDVAVDDADAGRVGGTVYDDLDGDGFGAGVAHWCTVGPNRSANPDDCDDTEPGLYPGQSVTVPSFLPPTFSGDLQQAIDRVCGAADLLVLPGVLSPTAPLDSRGKTLRIHGFGPAIPTPIASNVLPVFDVTQPGLTLEDLDLVYVGAIPTNAPVLAVSGTTLELAGVTLRKGNSTAAGGGLRATNALVLADSVVFSQNHAANGGGARVVGGFFACVACTFESNLADATGGALFADAGATVWIEGSWFENNDGAPTFQAANGQLFVDDTDFVSERDTWLENVNADVLGVRWTDSGDVDVLASVPSVVHLEDLTLIRGGSSSSATMSLAGGLLDVTLENSRFLQSIAGDMDLNSSSHHVRHNTFVDASDTQVHIYGGAPEVRNNTFYVDAYATVPNVAVTGTGLATNYAFNVLMNEGLPAQIPPGNNNFLGFNIYFQTYHPLLPPELWDLHVVEFADQIDRGTTALGTEPDASAPDTGAYGGPFFHPYYGDGDADGLADNWELDWFGTTLVDAAQDFDGDGWLLFDEFALGLSPLDPDTDHDGCDDANDPDGLDPFSGPCMPQGG